MRGALGPTLVKFGVFAVVMSVLTAFLFFTFGQYRTGAVTGYSALFNDASRLKDGDSVRVAGVRVGTVNGVALQPDKKVWSVSQNDNDTYCHCPDCMRDLPGKSDTIPSACGVVWEKIN